ncbi:hypothetical protein [Novosphingobium sp. B-7]
MLEIIVPAGQDAQVGDPVCIVDVEIK